jgi:hypothetical protein
VLAGEIYRTDHVDLEALGGTKTPESLDVTAPASSEAMIMADDQLAYRAAAQQDLPDESLGRESRQVTVEAEQKHVIKRGLRQNFQSFGPGGQQRRSGLRIHHFQWMGIEGDEHTGSPGRPGPPIDLLEHRLMAEVHSIERAHGNGGAVRKAGKRGCGEAGKSGHALLSTTVGRSHPSPEVAMATSSP